MIREQRPEVHEKLFGIAVPRARQPELDRMIDDTRRHRFDVLLAWPCDRLARCNEASLADD